LVEVEMNCVRIPKELYSFDDIPKQGAGEKMIMKRTNTLKLRPTEEQEKKLFELADNCSKLERNQLQEKAVPSLKEK